MDWTPTPDPFPHCVLDGYWPDDLLRAVVAEFPSHDQPGWIRYHNADEDKLEGPPPLWGPVTRQVLDIDIAGLAPILSEAFGIPDLAMETIGGGYHLIPPGGRLAIHTDFNRSPATGLYRRLNFLVFLNEHWFDPGGSLELWGHGGVAREVAPEFNRTAVFETSDRSWHGHPREAARWRRSIAAYFFSPEPPPGYAGDHSTVWRRDARAGL